MEYERLRNIPHKICKNRKRTHMDYRIRDIEENIKDKQTRNAYKEAGSLWPISNHIRTFEEAQIMRSYLRRKSKY
jgi:hypothetical protein